MQARPAMKRGAKRRDEDPDPSHTAAWYRSEMKHMYTRLNLYNKQELVDLYTKEYLPAKQAQDEAATVAAMDPHTRPPSYSENFYGATRPGALQ